jgi:hypothetical protein
LQTQGQSAAAEFLTLTRLREMATKQARLLVPGLGIEAESFFALSGKRKSGKSTLMMALAKSLALADPFCGLEIPDPVLVFYLDLEQPAAAAARRWMRLGAERAVESGRLHILPEQRLKLDTDAGAQRLVDALMPIRDKPEHGELPTVVLADPKGKLFGVKNEDDNAETDAACERVRRIIAELRCGVGLVAHKSPKENASSTTRGASSFEDCVDLSLAVLRDESDVTTVRGELIRFEEDLPGGARDLRLTIRHDGSETRLVNMGSAPLPGAQLKALAAIEATGGDRTAALERLDGEMGARSFDERVRELRDLGYITTIDRRYKRTDKPLPGQDGTR